MTEHLQVLDVEIESVTSALRNIAQSRKVTEHTNLLCVIYRGCTGCPIARSPAPYNQDMCAGARHTIIKPTVTMLVTYKKLLEKVRDNDDNSKQKSAKLLQDWLVTYPGGEKRDD